MANLTCSPKSGNAWNLYDLDSYHISLNMVDPVTIFGLQPEEFPEPLVDTELLTNSDASAMQ
ncbi:hypothetical protein BDQ17DRAFT_1171112, partial [Cyathus striatus]